MFRLVQNEGLGMISQGTREWTNYVVTRMSHRTSSRALVWRAVQVDGFYALVTLDQKVQLVKSVHTESVLAEAEFNWTLGDTST